MNLIETLQDDVAGYLAADAYFADVAVLNVAKGVTDSDVEMALTTLNAKSGKLGACVAVFMPRGKAVSENVPGPALELTLSLRVFESPAFNRDTGNGGTGKTAEAITEKVLALLHHWCLGCQVLLAADFTDFEVSADVVAKDLNFRITQHVTPVSRVPLPTISTSGLTVTLACSLAGAAIRYTTDGIFPGPSATLYSVPFVVTSGATVRAAAYKSGSAGSNVLDQVI